MKFRCLATAVVFFRRHGSPECSKPTVAEAEQFMKQAEVA